MRPGAGWPLCAALGRAAARQPGPILPSLCTHFGKRRGEGGNLSSLAAHRPDSPVLNKPITSSEIETVRKLVVSPRNHSLGVFFCCLSGFCLFGFFSNRNFCFRTGDSFTDLCALVVP